MVAKKYFTEQERLEARKAVHNAASKRYYERNRKVLIAKNIPMVQKRRKENPEQYKAYYTQYNKSRYEDEAFKAAKREYNRLWKRANRLKVREQGLALRHKRASRPGTVGRKQIMQLFAMSDGLCAYCITKHEPGQMHVDHILPLSRGGTNYQDNCVMACAGCNLKKKANTPLEHQYGWHRVTKDYSLPELVGRQAEEVIDLRSLCTYVKP